MPLKPGLSALGRRLIGAREERGISQSELARRLQVTRSAVAQWESGTTGPSMENLREAALELRVSFDWLATGRGQKTTEPVVATPSLSKIQHIPLLSWVSAGKLTEAGAQIPLQDARILTFSSLGRGDFFALQVAGDSMDRLSPDGSIIVINRADRQLIAGKAYVFSQRGEATYKLWEPEPPHLAPYSTNPAHKPIFVVRKRDLEVVGRVRRTVLDL